MGDEGGYAPNLKKDEDALKVIVAGHREGRLQARRGLQDRHRRRLLRVVDEEEKCYIQPKSGKKMTQQQLVNMWKKFADTYPIISLEDGMGETDWEGWTMLTKAIGDRVQLVGDDLFVTNTERLKTGIEKKVGNAILIKVNQIGTLTETLDAIQMANRAGYTAIVSHRSGETEDATIADIAVAVNAGQIKTGAPSRTDRVAKYNQLLRIEEELGGKEENGVGKEPRVCGGRTQIKGGGGGKQECGPPGGPAPAAAEGGAATPGGGGSGAGWGVATSLPNSSMTRRARSTNCTLLSASLPLEYMTLSSMPTRIWPPRPPRQ